MDGMFNSKKIEYYIQKYNDVIEHLTSIANKED
jgi:hypothetical protein